ncbi:MerR family transcriptional regulator [Dorea formicigenerans]|jgi:predicted site-specific integrase-resolvase|uniref:MerR family transcriptional regulator n=1 Tax=Dorea formicigenerans TaxID=39486 RepID=A0A3E4F9N1_9FIRM|nr:MerR family transcriptional regulator [Dorea formicigenerans]RGI89310.1 MerR family transcriptional regulator [Dorea formicigenerans]RGK50129.1 MerR family transcriptional regulator [Dorea formicigenerans]RGO54986.1 MerR family transcriptional regulator [Dorea formicigenerans]RGT11395.1 MerR family transcriptional regulator [Dorea formicigenerans]
MNTSNITNYKPKDFAELLGVSVKTLQRWDREGTLKANRTPTNRRYYTYDQYLQFKGINTENDERQVVIYARVSTRNQIVNNEELSPQEELVQDIVSILHVFSCRLYGLRKYKKQIEKDEEIAKELQDGNKSDRGTESQNS